MEIIVASIFLLCSNVLCSAWTNQDIVLRNNNLRQRRDDNQGIIEAPIGSEQSKPILKPVQDYLTLQEKNHANEEENNNIVYGNPKNIGITYGKTRERLLYTTSRKSDDLMGVLKILLQRYFNRKNPIVVLDLEDSNQMYEYPNYNFVQENDNENNANEILDDTDFGINDPNLYRRARKKSAFRDRSSMYSDSTSSSSSTSSDLELNPGNPYTIHDDKYKQNWMWKHDMDGEHMNINPYGPQLNDLEPTGADLFFGRKWWYFNQDDYVPL